MPKGASAEKPRQLPLLASLARKKAAAAGEDAEKVTPARREKVAKPKKVVGKEKKKVKKGAPAEVSSRRPIAPPQAAKRKAPQARDPRFDDFSGKLDMDLFEKSYGFLEEYRQEELQTMKKEVHSLQKKQRRRANAVDAEQQETLLAEVRKRVSQDKQRRHLGEMRSAERELRGEERKKVEETGKVPYFHSRGKVRSMVLEKRKASRPGGGRDKQEEKREKKLAGREKKRLPTRRNRDAE
mmetsp:Transcript_11816/g.31189  ORF Transcript_11816/g.31189 Transcript_11816/m.31189 type:complete len:240 (+) Transcript_11816:109-828(+)